MADGAEGWVKTVDHVGVRRGEASRPGWAGCGAAVWAVAVDRIWRGPDAWARSVGFDAAGERARPWDRPVALRGGVDAWFGPVRSGGGCGRG
jgi:hypothetical protein